jgi:hypothetical protein
MPDYALCMNEKCKEKNNCCRFLGVPNEYRQSYIMTETEEPCDAHWPTEVGAPFELKKPEQETET